MKQTLRHIFLLVAMFMATASAWAADCTYEYSTTVYNTNIKNNGDVIAQYEFTNVYGLSSISYILTLQCSVAGKDLQYKVQYLPSNSSTWTDTNISTSTLNGTWQAWRSESSESKTEAISSSSSIFNARGIRIISNTKFGSKRTVSVNEVKFVMAKTLSGSEETMPFDNQVYNTTSSAKTRDFTFSNVATGKSISITNNTNATEFPAEITKNGDCTGSVTVSVKFKPSQKGTRTGQITVSGDCGSKTFTVTGNGLLATPTLTLKGTTGLVDRTADVAKPNYIDLSVFFDTYIGDGYKYEVVSSNSQYAHFDGDNFYATEKGEYTIHITSPAGDHYSDTFADGKKYRELVITVRDKARPVYNANYTQSSADGMLVDGIIENAYTLTNVSNDAYFACNISVTSISDVNDGSGRVISYDAKNNKIIAHNAGTATLQFVQTENNDYYGEESPKYTFTVSKHQTSFGGEAYSMMVEGTQIANYSYTNTSSVQPTALSADDFYYTIDNVVFANEELNKGTDLITFNPSTKQITACNAGTAKITLHHKETYKYTGATASYNVTVNKYTPTFTWNAGNATYYYLSSIPNIFSTTNPDCQYTIVSDNEHVAKVIDNTLHIYNVEETANITVTQSENYKWNGKTETYTITPANLNNHVTFTYTQAMFNDGTITTQKVSQYGVEWTSDNQLRLGGSSKTVLPGNPAYDWDDKYIVIHFEGIPKDISFKYKANTSDVSNGANALKRADWYIAEGVEGPNGEIKWSDNYPWKNLGGENSNSTDWVKVSNQPLQSTTRYLKLCYSGNFAGYYSDIVVTELEKFEAAPKPLDFGTKPVGEGEQLLQLNFSHTNAGRITTDTIIGKDAKYFTVTPTIIPGTGRDMSGTTHLNVTFANNGEDRGLTPYEATLVITDNAGHREEVQLTGIRHGKSTPVFTWNPNNFPYYFNTSIANIVVSSNTDYANCPLTITSSNENIAKVENGRLYIYNQSGEVTFTVSQQENDSFEDHTETFTFTPKAKPDLTAPFQVTHEIYNQAITVGKNCSWDGNDHHLKLGDGAWDDTKKTAILVFSGRPDKLTFSYATSNNVAVVEIGSFNNPKWEVEESSDGENWKSLWSVRTNSTSWANAEIQLSETTQYVRFSYDGNYAGYFKNINISELVGYKYLRAADGHYLSRGAKWGTQAVVDAFGVVSRISRYTEDNENIYTRFFFVDNEQYMFETETKDAQRLHEVFTDDDTADNTNNLWQINNNGGILTIQSANDVGVSHKGNYITAVNGVLAFTTNEAEATKWQMEDYTEHPQYIADMLNRQAAAAALKDFGEDINTLEKVRNRLKVEDFETREITIQPLALGEQTGESRTIEGMPHIYEQTITGLDTGFYRLTVKALYRISNSEIAWKCNQDKGKESVLAYVYANDVQYPIQSVYASYHSSPIENTDELHNGKYYSTTLSSANVAFNDANRYLNDVYVYVEADPGQTTGTLRYGIKCPSYVPEAWLAYSTITLTRFGRKEYIFQSKDVQNPTDWNTPANWNRNEVPNQFHKVRIETNATISSHAEVFSLTIDPDVSIHITSTGGLSVGALGIHGAAADGSSIILDNLKTGAGFLRISPEYKGTMPRLTMRYQTKSTLDDGANKDATWQYIGAPGADCKFTVDYITWLYHWSETQGWINKTGTLTLEPFAGYAITQYGKPTYELVSTIINENRTITLTKTDTENGMKGDNLFANSYSAPLDAKNFTDEDFCGDIVKTFYLFNSGSWNDWNNNQNNTLGSNNSDTPGQYRAIPALAAEYLNTTYDQTTISPMQGVYMITNEDGASIKLNYNKHVWQAGNKGGTNMHEPMRAPIHNVFKSNNFRRLRIQVNSANSGADRMYVIQDTITTTNYDNGYDAPNQMAEGLANIYTNEHFGQMEVSCSNHIDSTFVGFTAGSDSIYTLRFNAIIGDDLHLYDLDNDSIILIEEDATYTFHTTPHSQNNLRFQILLHPEKNLDFGEEEKDEIYTNVTNVHTTQVWSYNSNIYINNAPANTVATLFNISGHKLLTTPIHYTPYTLDLSYLPKGMYMLQLNTQVYKFVIQ